MHSKSYSHREHDRFDPKIGFRLEKIALKALKLIFPPFSTKQSQICFFLFFNENFVSKYLSVRKFEKIKQALFPHFRENPRRKKVLKKIFKENYFIIREEFWSDLRLGIVLGIKKAPRGKKANRPRPNQIAFQNSPLIKFDNLKKNHTLYSLNQFKFSIFKQAFWDIT